MGAADCSRVAKTFPYVSNVALHVCGCVTGYQAAGANAYVYIRQCEEHADA